MDIIPPLTAGIVLRIVLFQADSTIGNITPVLLGLWEGVAIHNAKDKPNFIDHFLALGLRIIIDFIATNSPPRLILTILSSLLGAALSQTLSTSGTGKTHRSHRRKSSRSILPHIQDHIAQTPQHLPHFLPSIVENHTPVQQSTPILPLNRPATPPSFYLEGESETITPHQSPILHHLPTPPTTSVSDTVEADDADAQSHRRLSTVAEEQSVLEDADVLPGHLDLPQLEDTQFSYAPSLISVPPIPVPNVGLVRRPLRRQKSEPSSDSDSLGTPVREGGRHLPNPSDDELATPAQATHSKLYSPSLHTKGYPDAEESEHPDLILPVRPRIAPPNAVSQVLSPLTAIEFNLNPGVESFIRPAVDNSPLRTPDGAATRASSLERNYPIIQPPHANSPLPSGKHFLKQPDRAAVASPTPTDTSSVVSYQNGVAKAEALRRQSRLDKEKIAELKNELKEAEADPSRIKDAFLLRQRIKDMDKLVKKELEQAEKRFFQYHNRNKNPQTIDLHGLRPAKAIERTELAIRDCLENGHPTLNVIVGKGLHSHNNVPVLGTAVLEAVRRHGFVGDYLSTNRGVLVVNMPS